MKCKFKSLAVNGKSFKIYWNTEWDEYIVKFYRNDDHRPAEDYHCGDYDEAMGTGVSYQIAKEN